MTCSNPTQAKRYASAWAELASAAARSKGTRLGEKFFRLQARRAHKRAAVGAAHKILIAAYPGLDKQISYNELVDADLVKRSRKNLTGS